MINYADITFNDRNPIKRKLQRIRLWHSLSILKNVPRNFTSTLLDFGSGDATLCTQIATLWPKFQIFSYEPTPELREQALLNIHNFNNIYIIDSLDSLKKKTFDYIFCLEVLEHLSIQEIEKVLRHIYELSHSKTFIVIGIPNEIYLSALIKGIFRMTRRFGDVDAIPSNILKATIGKPPLDRPIGNISKGLPYIFRHMGFDHRKIKTILKKRFHIHHFYGSPFPYLSDVTNFELYFICQKKGGNFKKALKNINHKI